MSEFKEIKPFTSKSPLSSDTMNAVRDNLDYLRMQLDLDALWDKMYVKAKSVIITCQYCGSHNAISNPNCIQCGGTFGKDF